MPLPNVIIAGAQKSGTTWLHRSLDKSSRIFASDTKELNFFNTRKVDDPDRLAAYESHFPEVDGVTHWLESTPHYFRRPRTGSGVDVARNVREVLGDDVAIMVVLRDPVDRYESAYTHHVLAGRFAHSPLITEITDDKRMLYLGRYAEHLEHWLGYFPDMKVMLYDDVVGDPLGVAAEVMDHLGLPNDLAPDDLLFRTNDKYTKHSRRDPDWEVMPRLAPETRAELNDYYRDDVAALGGLLGRDLSGWLHE